MSLGWQTQFFAIAVIAGLVMVGLWAVQRRTRDAGIVDVGWAVLLGMAAAFCGLTGEGDPARRAIIGGMGAIWGLRLGSHLLLDRVLRGPEDGRYQMMRERYGSRINTVLLGFFLAQGLLVVVLATPFVLAARDPRPGPAALDLLAVGVWAIGLVGESVADRQLKRFKSDPANAGRVCEVGLWRYSRHPNYFFEWLVWIAFALPATMAPAGYLAWAAPALMLLFVLKLTGIPPTEARALRSRGEAYREYQRTTSAFVPWFRRRIVRTAQETAR